ncbi:MAG: hypothetical protein KGI98_07365 [Euryarchaeota archaeon]|nr:hypothetical protein [Euryarchaeota archaeon]MDE1880078.1 hypothetical protein [Euryarchaeota archaeon]
MAAPTHHPGSGLAETSGAREERSSATLPTLTARITTEDRGAGSNQGISASVYLPNQTIAPGENWTLLLAEPVNATAAFGVGLIGWQNGSRPMWDGFYELWNFSGFAPTQVFRNLSSPFLGGSTLSLDFSWSHGLWWQAHIGGRNLSAPGGNGSVDLGALTAAGLSFGTAPFHSPTFEVEGNSTTFPGVLSLPATLAIEQGGSAHVPSNAIWWASQSGWTAEGEDQNTALPMGAVLMGTGASSAPSNGSWLWGIGGPAFRTLGNLSAPSSPSASGFATTLNLTLAGTSGSNVSSYAVTLLMPLSPSVTIGVGAWVHAPGPTSVLPFYVENRSGVLRYFAGDFDLLNAAGLLRLEASSSGGGVWSFTAGATAILGTSAGGALSEGNSVTSAGGVPELLVQEGVPGPATPTPLSLATVVELNASGAWSIPSKGVVGAAPIGCAGCSSVPVEGNSQDLFLPPGSAQVLASLSPLPTGTLLWNGSPGPRANVTLGGIPSQVGSLSRVSAIVEVNGSGMPLSSPQVELVLPPEVTAAPPWYLSSGGAVVNLTFPLTTGPTLLTVSARGVAPGYSPGVAGETFWLVPGNLTVSGHLTGPPLAPSKNGTLEVWVNGTDGIGPLSNATLALQSSLGAVLGPPVFDPSTVSYDLGYTAPSVSQPTTDSVTIFATVPGFVLTGGRVQVPLAPQVLSLAVRSSSGPVASGSVASFEAWVNGTSGAPISGATIYAVFGLYAFSGPLTTRSPTFGTYTFNLSVPLVPHNGSYVVLAEATFAGYGPDAVQTHATVVVQPLEAAASVSKLSQGTFGIFLMVRNASGPVAGAEASVSAESGTVVPPSSATNGTGASQFVWVPPAGASGSFVLRVSVSALGFYPRNLTLSITVAASSGPLGLPPSDWFLLAPLAVLATFFALWVVGRWKAGPPRPRLGKTPSKPPPEDQARQKGKEKPEGEVSVESDKTFLPKESLGIPGEEAGKTLATAPSSGPEVPGSEATPRTEEEERVADSETADAPGARPPSEGP